jgi:catalase
MANEILNDSKNSNEDDNMQMFVIKADEVLNSQGDYEEEDDKQAIEELKLVFGDMSMDGKTSKEGDQRVDYVEEENMFRDMSEQEKAQVVEKFDMLVKKGQSYNYINKNDDYKDP